MKSIPFFVLAIFAAAGCQQGPAKSSTSQVTGGGASPQVAQNDAPAPTTDQTQPKAGQSEAPSDPKVKPEPGKPEADKPRNPTNPGVTPAEPQPDPYKIPDPKIQTPRADIKADWNKTIYKAVDIAKRMDRGLFETKNALCNFEIAQQGKSVNSGTDSGVVKLKNESTYLVEYFFVDHLGSICKAAADGKQTQELTADGWSEPQNVPQGWRARSSKVLGDFSIDFPKEIFMPIIGHKSVWEALTQEWTAKGGKAVVESKEMAVNGKKRPFYRLMFTSKNAKMPIIEARFDAIRMVPLTVRIEYGAGDGKVIRQWSGRWAFNGTFGPSEFKLPGAPR